MTGPELKGLPTRAGLTQAEAAAKCGISQEMWSMMETGAKAVP